MNADDASKPIQLADEKDIETRLLRSDSVKSLMAEQEVVEAFRKMYWWTVEHGSFYRDSVTGKVRELDVRARRHWSTEGGTDSRNATLDVLVEVKSIRGFHLVFAPEPHDWKDTRAQSLWLGRSKDRLARFLLDTGVASDLASQITTRFTELAYPEGSSFVDDIIVNPPEAPVFATAFRETNIGQEKDLDASVLWRATQVLSSVIESARTRLEQNFVDDLKADIEVATIDGANVLEAAAREIALRVKSVSLFHPAVVVDARMWVSRERKLEEVEHVRFVAHDSEKFPVKWFDIVTRKHFAKWLSALTAHYRSRLEHPNEPIWKGSADALLQFMEMIRDPDNEIEMKVKKRNSEEPAKRVLLKKYRKRPRKGLKPVPL